MKKFGLLLALLAAPSIALPQEFLNEEWGSFKETYGKSYTSAEEEARKKVIFEQNLELVIQHNKRYAEGNITYKLAMNRFGDMVPSELTPEVESATEDRANLEGMPSPAVLLNITVFREEVGRGRKELISLEADQESCFAAYPYCGPERRKSLSIFYRRRVEKYNALSKQDLEELLTTHGPLCVLMSGSSRKLFLYSKGVFYYQKCVINPKEHAAKLVGYGATKDGDEFWVINNTWGADWGEGGFIRLKKDLGHGF